MPSLRPPRSSDRPHRRPFWIAVCAGAVLSLSILSVLLRAQAPPLNAAFREPAWSPDGERLAVIVVDRLWTVLPDGSQGKPLTALPGREREPAWSPDGRLIAFAADHDGGFDIYTVAADGGTPSRVTSLPGDERSPSWTPDGRLVFAHRDDPGAQSDLFMVDVAGPVPGEPRALTRTPDQELQPRVSPDGTRVAFVSDQNSDDGDFDIWSLPLPRRGGYAPSNREPTPLVRARGQDAYPSWSPDGRKLTFYGVRAGVGSTWVVQVAAASEDAVMEMPSKIVSSIGGVSAWSPDGTLLAIAALPEPEPAYNGNPSHDREDRPPAFALGRGYQLFVIDAPATRVTGARALTRRVEVRGVVLAPLFDDVAKTLRRLYYAKGDNARAWDALVARYRPMAARAETREELETVVDRLVAEQPLIKPAITSSTAVVVSAHPLASEIGRRVLARGGNIVDAAIAVSFVLGVVEPDASGIGGDGQAVLYLRGMPRPTVVEFKDQTPAAATVSNPKLWRDGRIVGDGPAASNVPGLVAGLDYLFTHYASGTFRWPELMAPAIQFAEDGFVLDDTLPSTVAEGRHMLGRYSAASRIFLPGGAVPRAGDRFTNSDYAATLRTLARDGAGAFYRGSIARAIAADMAAHGGVMTAADLSDYRVSEHTPAVGRYRGHLLFTGGPPVSAAVSMLEALQVLGLSAVRPGVTAQTDAAYWHQMIESWKVRDQVGRGSEAWLDVSDYDRHLAQSHTRALFSRIKAGASGYADDAEDTLNAAVERIGTGTSAFTIVDADGNMISMTQTLSTWGGSFYVTPGLGFLYNNHLRATRGGPGSTGSIAPATRSNTATVPTLGFIDRDGVLTPRFALGVAGNAWIPASGYSIIAALIDGGLTMQQAIEAPRFLVERDPADPSGTGARIEIEDRFPRQILEDLMARGHRFQKIGRKGELRYGYASGALVDVEHHRVEGGADPRRSHTAVALDLPVSATQ